MINDPVNSISVVSVFNDRDVYRKCIEASCQAQSLGVELIGVDNTRSRFSSATAALNWGAAQASGSWIVFAHQDIVLLTASWARRLAEILRDASQAGWYGVVGRDVQGIWQGLLRDRDFVFGQPFKHPIEVQTLDEVVLIHARKENGKYFDEGLDGWHAYGVDACCDAIRTGGRNYVLPLPVWHDSPSSNRANLREAHDFVAQKHVQAFKRIRTSCGDIPARFQRKGSFRVHQILTSLRLSAVARKTNVAKPSNQMLIKPSELLDDWTLQYDEIHSLRESAWFATLEAVGLQDATPRKRLVKHWFGEWPDALSGGIPVVVGPEVTNYAAVARVSPAHVFVSQLATNAKRMDAIAEQLNRKPNRSQVCRDQDERLWVVTEFGEPLG